MSVAGNYRVVARPAGRHRGFLFARPLDVNGIERLLRGSEADSRATTIM
jgi:hypothetical protein